MSVVHHHGIEVSVPRKAFAWLVLAFAFAVTGTALYGVTGGLYGFMAKDSLYLGCSGSVLLTLLISIGYLHTNKKSFMQHLFKAFGALDVVQKLLYILMPAFMLYVAVFMLANCVAVAFSFLPFPAHDQQLFVHSKETSSQRHTCPFQAAVSMAGDTWLNQCLTKNQYERFRQGNNSVRVKETLVGYYIQ